MYHNIWHNIYEHIYKQSEKVHEFERNPVSVHGRIWREKGEKENDVIILKLKIIINIFILQKNHSDSNRTILVQK